jgi:putative transposase
VKVEGSLSETRDAGKDRYPSAATSVREGLEETLTVLKLGLSDRLRQSLATTNAIESLISRSRAT